MIVVDASATVDYLLRLEPGYPWVLDRFEASAKISAPHLLDVEVAQAIRRFVRTRGVDAMRGAEALADLAAFRVVRYPHVQLLEAVWDLRDILSAYDAAYVALTEALDATLLTTDAKLARVAGERVRVEVPA